MLQTTYIFRQTETADRNNHIYYINMYICTSSHESRVTVNATLITGACALFR